jgi:diacylglycerol kinase (ATP)
VNRYDYQFNVVILFTTMTHVLPVIINPAAGARTAVLAELNHVFQAAGVRWSVEITHGLGDAADLAAQLAAQGAEIVAVYGGDGTISEVASGLAGTQTAMGLLPGGTGNVLTFEFGIPRNLTRAARLIISEHDVRVVDVGQVGQRSFLLRVGAGLEALTVKQTTRKMKDQFGLLAYGIAGLQALVESRPVIYQMDLDGQQVEVKGVLCTVANASHFGVLPGLTLSSPIDIADGLLDVIVMDRVDLQNTLALFSKSQIGPVNLGRLKHWQVRSAVIDAQPTQATQVDGDTLGTTPLSVRSLPKALRVIVPCQLGDPTSPAIRRFVI